MTRYLDTLDLNDLPERENDRFEYKGSLTTFDQVAKKLPKAASAFWNSGGGTFLLGVDDKTGKPDGGVSTQKGNQDVRDWLDKIVSNLPNLAPYDIRIYSPSDAPSLNIDVDKCVAAVHFERYQGAPVMAPDAKYYIRAGAHSDPASGFIVEALFANRKASTPMLTHTLRMKHHDDDVVQLGIVSLSESPAINVTIDFDPRPEHYDGPNSYLPLKLPVVSVAHPFFMDYTFWYDENEHRGVNVLLNVTFEDSAGNAYSYSSKIDIKRCISPMTARGGKSLTTLLGGIKKSIDELTKQHKNGR